MNSNESTSRSAERRRELNRQAAQKLRNRQKEKAIGIKQQYFAAQSKNTQLNYEVKQLRRFKEELELQFKSHVPICQRTSSSQSTATAHYGRSASLPVSQSQPTPFPIAYYPSLPSGQLTPFNFNGNQIVMCSAGVSSDGLQLLTIAPYPLEGGSTVNGDVLIADEVSISNNAEEPGDVCIETANEETVNSSIEAITNQDTEAGDRLTSNGMEVGNNDSNGDNNDNDDDNDNNDAVMEVDVKLPVAASSSTAAALRCQTRRAGASTLAAQAPAQRPAPRKRSSPVKRQSSKSSSSQAAATSAAAATDADRNLPLMVSVLSEDD